MDKEEWWKINGERIRKSVFSRDYKDTFSEIWQAALASQSGKKLDQFQNERLKIQTGTFDSETGDIVQRDPAQAGKE